MENYWLTVPGAALTNDERKFLYDTAQEIESRFDKPLIFNLGVFWAASLWCLRQGAPNADLYGIDIDYISHKPKYRSELWNTTLIEGNSHTYHTIWHKPLHFLFIDGDHTYESVKKDIAGWVPKIVDGGIVAFHDYAPKEVDLERDPTLVGVKQSVNEWFNRNRDDWNEIQAPDSIRAFRKESRCQQ